jgi:very-short-patch-repair endonuclease
MPKLYNLEDVKPLRRKLRGTLTPAEAILWRALQGSKLHGRKFRRQQSIGSYVVDYYCPAEKLVVELDGAAHDSPEAARYDEERAAFLSAAGVLVLRIENRHLVENPDGVLALIAQHFRGKA